ncbi:MAG: RNA pseudouridine synthase, partial [Candidatus Harrisonbacteria bacterium]|nr:RNA pseudouridine synthase [Candidatus Harrisonbacteria bacterium]
MVNALVARYPDIVGVGENPLRPGIVHRLDKDTSGLIVVAKNQHAFLFVKEQFLKRAVQKTYLALVEGIPKAREGVIAYDIRPSKQNRLKKVAITKSADSRGLDADLTRTDAEKNSAGSASSPRKSALGRTAETRYKVRETFGDTFALLEVTPKTGRTHQIRVHLAAIGVPVLGDTFYGAHKDVAKSLGVKR